MFNSSSNINTTFPIFYEDNNISLSHLNDEINPFSYYDQVLSPMGYYDIENYSHLLSNHDFTMPQDPFQATNINSPIATDDSSIGLEVPTNNKIDASKGDDVSNNGMVVRPKKRRTSNKDRHSKIRTANGLRDRRMRLSLEVARPFFKLQDMLGYDKGSMTVEWLLTRSKEAIDELIQSKNNGIGIGIGGSTSSITKCTAISSISDCDEGESIVVEQKKKATNNRKEKKDKGNVGNFVKIIKEKRLRTTKEAMKKTRDKARKRTLEKRLSRGIIKDAQNSHHLAFKTCEMEANYDSCTINNTCGNWSPFTNFNFQPNGDICQCDMSRGTLME